MNGFPGFVSPLVSQPYKLPCRIVPNPNDYSYCNAASGEHTALDLPICDTCWSFIKEDDVP